MKTFFHFFQPIFGLMDGWDTIDNSKKQAENTWETQTANGKNTDHLTEKRLFLAWQFFFFGIKQNVIFVIFCSF